MLVSRRSFTFGATGAAFLPFLPASALAGAPKAATQVPGFFRTMIGDLELTALADGFIALDATTLLNGTPAAAELLGMSSVPTSVNGWLINNGGRLILVDSGTSTAMGDTLGKLAANLQAAGYTPDQVDDVVITHLHPDHANGLLKGDEIVFPRASIHVAESELAFWSDDSLRDQDPDKKLFFDIARRVVKPYQAAGKLVPFGEGEILPGITAIAAPGHTPGHSMLRLSSGNAGLLIWGDVVHNAALQFADPGRTVSFDVDAQQAAATRLRAFDLAAADKLLVAGAHLPFPGLGYVTKAAGIYRYVAEPWKAVP